MCEREDLSSLCFEIFPRFFLDFSCEFERRLTRGLSARRAAGIRCVSPPPTAFFEKRVHPNRSSNTYVYTPTSIIKTKQVHTNNTALLSLPISLPPSLPPSLYFDLEQPKLLVYWGHTMRHTDQEVLIPYHYCHLHKDKVPAASEKEIMWHLTSNQITRNRRGELTYVKPA